MLQEIVEKVRFIMNLKKGFSFIFILMMLIVLNVKFAFANENLQVRYQVLFANENNQDKNLTWTDEFSDNTRVYSTNSYPTAIKIGLINQDPNMSGTVLYEVNSSGSGWLDKVYNRQEAGQTIDASKPIEAIKVYLNGELEKNYDIYYQVLQGTKFSPWYKNGEIAGIYGKGTHISGLVLSLRKKGESPLDNFTEINLANPSNIDPNKPMIALTYDDGPSSLLTPKLLDILEENSAKATFFVLGNRVLHNKNLIKRMSDLGQEIGNHTFEHKLLTSQTEEQRIQHLSMTSNLIKEITGKEPKIARAPGGAINEAALNTLAKLNMRNIMWSIDTLDWKHKNVSKTVDTVLSQIRDGDIILMMTYIRLV